MGLIGLGNMGTAIAERVLEAGYPLVVHNRSLEKAAPYVDRGATLAGGAALLGVRPIASLADEASADYLRAPVSGNPSVVRAGNLALIVSGPREALERVEPVLRAIGPEIHYVGDAEQARVVKLAINLMIAGLAELMSEALVLGEMSGVSREALLEVMGSSAVGAPFVKYKTEPLLADDFAATFTTALMEKDIDLVLDAARQSEVELPLAQHLKALLRAAVEAGYADDDFMALYLHLRGAASEEVAR